MNTAKHHPMETTSLPITLALADDHQLFRKGLRLIFEEQKGFEVAFEAENGQQLVDALAQKTVDVVLLDLEMPKMNGAEALKIIREVHPTIKVLLLTMHDNEKYMISFLQQGAHGYLLKDASPDELVFGVKKVHESGRYINDRVSEALLNRLNGLKTETASIGEPHHLGEREMEVLRYICEEYTTTEMADKMFLSTRTIESYRKRLLEKTGARNTAGLVRFAIEKELFKI